MRLFVFGGAALAGGAAAGAGSGRGFFLLPDAKAHADGPGGAGSGTGAAADAFGAVRGLGGIHIHQAYLFAFAAVDAFVFIDFQPVKAVTVQ